MQRISTCSYYIGLNLSYKMCILIIHPNNYSDIMSAAKNINHYEICLINRNHYVVMLTM